jgi:hypothetical protein
MFLSCYLYVLSMAEELHYILNIVWARKLNHNKDSTHVSSITNGQTVLILWHLNTTASSACGTLHCYWCIGLSCDKLQSLIRGQKRL